jgi:hypothetical protein
VYVGIEREVVVGMSLVIVSFCYLAVLKIGFPV